MATLRELAQTLLRTAPGSEEETTAMMQMCEHCAEVTSVAESERMQQLLTVTFDIGNAIHRELYTPQPSSACNYGKGPHVYPVQGGKCICGAWHIDHTTGKRYHIKDL